MNKTGFISILSIIFKDFLLAISIPGLIFMLQGFAKAQGTETNAPSAAATPPAQPPASKEAVNVSGSTDNTFIQVGDKLKYFVKEDKDDPVVLAVLPTGEMDVPYLGRVNVSGKTIGAAKGDIKRRLEKDLYYQATVEMWVEVSAQTVGAIKANQVTVSGAVRMPGPQDMPIGSKYMLSTAILKAGGLNPFGNGKKIKIERVGKDGKQQEIIGNVDAVLKEGKRDKDIELQKDDLIIVPEKLINF